MENPIQSQKKESVSGLIYNSETESITFVKKYTDFYKKGWFLEPVNTIIDGNKSPVKTFIEEGKKSTCYKIKKKNIVHDFYGYFSEEKIYFFLAVVTNNEKTKKENKQKNAETIEYHYLQFMSLIEKIEDIRLKLLVHEAHTKKLFEL